MCKEEHKKMVNRNVFPGNQGGPLVHVIAGKAVCFHEALGEGFRAYQAQILKNAAVLAGILQDKGFRIVSGGTDNHLFLLDVFSRGLTGKDAEEGLEKAGFTVNKNTIPFDQHPPMVTSGVRIGTPAVTTRGMKEPEMELIGSLIAETLAGLDSSEVVSGVREKVKGLTSSFPLYPDLVKRA